MLSSCRYQAKLLHSCSSSLIERKTLCALYVGSDVMYRHCYVGTAEVCPLTTAISSDRRADFSLLFHMEHEVTLNCWGNL
jgi:hypothetical protein